MREKMRTEASQASPDDTRISLPPALMISCLKLTGAMKGTTSRPFGHESYWTGASLTSYNAIITFFVTGIYIAYILSDPNQSMN
jgi:hypothetical protein